MILHLNGDATQDAQLSQLLVEDRKSPLYRQYFSPQEFGAQSGVVTTFTVSSTAKAGTYTATLSATGGGLTQTVPISLTITAK